MTLIDLAPFHELFPITNTEAALILGAAPPSCEPESSGAHGGYETQCPAAPVTPSASPTAGATTTEPPCFDRIAGDTFISLLRNRICKRDSSFHQSIEISAVGGTIDAPAAIYAEVMDVFAHALEEFVQSNGREHATSLNRDPLLLSIKETHSYLRIELSFPLVSDERARQFRDRLLCDCADPTRAILAAAALRSKKAHCFACARDVLHEQERTVAVQFGNNHRVNVAVERPLRDVARSGLLAQVGDRVVIINCSDVRAVLNSPHESQAEVIGRLKTVDLFAALRTQRTLGSKTVRLVLQTRLNPIAVEVDSIGPIVSYRLADSITTDHQEPTIAAQLANQRAVSLLDADRLNLL